MNSTSKLLLDVSEHELQQDLAYGRRGPVLDGPMLDATIEVLAERGLAGTSIESVARHRGVAKTTIYRRWPNREALIAAAVHRFVGERVAVPDTGSLRGDLLEIARATVALVQRPGFRSIAPELVGAAQRDQEWASALRDRFVEPGRDALAVSIDRAITRGELAADVSTELVIELLVGALTYRSFITRGQIDEDYVEQVVDTVYRGVAA